MKEFLILILILGMGGCITINRHLIPYDARQLNGAIVENIKTGEKYLIEKCGEDTFCVHDFDKDDKSVIYRKHIK